MIDSGTSVPTVPSTTPQRLHIGCGGERLEGWVNIDVQSFPGVDVVADVRAGLDFRNVDAVFAEHFLEHLTITEAVDFLCEAHRVLRPGGWIRISTPNLEWVWATHSSIDRARELRAEVALVANRSFYGWGHRFLWNEALLRQALEATGFEKVHANTYGESSLDFFRGLERHERYADDDNHQHVLILEAAKGGERPEALRSLRDLVQTSFLNHLAASDVVSPDSDPQRRVRELTMLLESERRRLTAELAAEHTRRLAAERDWLDASQTLRRVERSPSFRLGRALTAPIRALRNLLGGN